MPLSDERKQIFEKAIETKLREIRRRVKEVLDIYDLYRGRGQCKAEMYEKHAEHMRELGEFVIKAYKEGLKKDGRRMKADDVSEIYWKQTGLFNKMAGERDLQVPDFLGSS